MSGAKQEVGRRWRRGPVVREIASRHSCSEAAAHQRYRRVWERFQDHCTLLSAHGQLDTLTHYAAWLHDLIDQGPLPRLEDALALDGKLDRDQDAARDECLIDGATAEELRRIIRNTERELGPKLTLIRVAKAELAKAER